MNYASQQERKQVLLQPGEPAEVKYSHMGVKDGDAAAAALEGPSEDKRWEGNQFQIRIEPRLCGLSNEAWCLCPLFLEGM